MLFLYILHLILVEIPINVNHNLNFKLFLIKKPRQIPLPGSVLCYFPGNSASMATRAASCSARFLLVPEPEPMGFPLSRTSTQKRLS